MANTAAVDSTSVRRQMNFTGIDRLSANMQDSTGYLHCQLRKFAVIRRTLTNWLEKEEKQQRQRMEQTMHEFLESNMQHLNLDDVDGNIGGDSAAREEWKTRRRRSSRDHLLSSRPSLKAMATVSPASPSSDYLFDNIVQRFRGISLERQEQWQPQTHHAVHIEELATIPQERLERETRMSENE